MCHNDEFVFFSYNLLEYDKISLFQPLTSLDSIEVHEEKCKQCKY